MFASVRRATVVAMVGMTTLWLPVQQVHAGPFLDWLLRRPILVYPSPQVAAYPGVPVAAVPAQTSFYAPAHVGAAPAVVAHPVVANSPIVAAPAVMAPTTVIAASPVIAPAPVAVQPAIAGYTTYRTTWNRIPVTYYRPATTYVAGYPAVAAQPCNTFTWQAQRVPTRVHRPWLPFSPVLTYGYAPQPAAVQYAPAAPACGACPTVGAAPAVSPYYSPVIPNTVAPAGSTFGIPVQLPENSASGLPADQVPALLPGTFSTEPVETAPQLQSVPEVETTPAFVPADSASAQRTSGSPYRVTPIPAPDLRTFEAQRKGTQAPPLLKGRERTVSNSAGQPVSIERTSWVTTKASTSQPSTATAKPAAKPRWNDSGWHSAK